MEEDDITLGTRLNIFAGPDLFRVIRARFIARGTSLQSWCRENGIHRQNARKCLMGTWRGPKAIILLERLVAASGAQHAG